MIIGQSRRAIAEALGHPDTSAGIPEARWMRAMQFERLIRHEDFVSPLLTTAVGALGLERPEQVRRSDGGVTVAVTAQTLEQAHKNAVEDLTVTLITSLAIPFVGMESEAGATPVKPDFAIVAPRLASPPANPKESPLGSWLIMGDAKDYERVRSRIDDQRMLKGFLQVALGAESAASWSALPSGMTVHEWGALAVPRNSFLQPEAVVEDLGDHRREVMARVEERTTLVAELGGTPIDDSDLSDFVDHLEAAFDPATCASCSLFNFCRNQVRDSSEPVSLLVELGVRPEVRSAVLEFLEDGSNGSELPISVLAPVLASVHGLPERTDQKRVDLAGTPGSINVVLAKSESGALAVHGVGVQRTLPTGDRSPWEFQVFESPQSPPTRLMTMELLGEQLEAALTEQSADSGDEVRPVSVLVPDSVTADVLVSIADSLAGIETSRLRWRRDIEAGRDPLTFNGEPATVPPPLSERQRLAVSFLLEEDRSRAMKLRWPLVDLRSVLASHVIPGGPSVDRGRLDYLVQWATATSPLDHRAVSDGVAASVNTPGARLSNDRSDELHALLRSGGTRYEAAVLDELEYKSNTVDNALEFLATVEDSHLRPVNLALEADAQVIWRRRLELQASDLVRFGRTSWVWRNKQVELLDSDLSCDAKLAVLGNPASARDAALDAGNRHVAMASVASTNPLRITLGSRRLGEGSHVVAVRLGDQMAIESKDVDLKIQKGSFKFSGLALGPLKDFDDSDDSYLWDPRIVPDVAVGEQLVVADAQWFRKDLFKSGHEISVDRPSQDDTSAPKPECHEHSYEYDPDEHRYCCRSHAVAEAEWSDVLAERRQNGELNPETWPPVLDDDQFDTPADGSATIESVGEPGTSGPPPGATIDELE